MNKMDKKKKEKKQSLEQIYDLKLRFAYIMNLRVYIYIYILDNETFGFS